MGRQGARRKLDRCIYEHDTGVSIVVQVNGQRPELRFPLGTDLERLKKNRDQQQADLRDADPATARGMLAADAKRYLKLIAARAGFKADRSHLRAWLDRLGPRPRARITGEDVGGALAA